MNKNKDVVLFHNDVNRVPIGHLNSNELNLFWNICNQLNDQQDKTIAFGIAEAREWSGASNLTFEEIVKLVISVIKKIKEAGFSTILLEKSVSEVALFTDMSVLFTEKVSDKVKQEVRAERGKLDLEWIAIRFKNSIKEFRIGINTNYKYLLNDFTKEYTALELREHAGITSKYGKTLLRLLKQFIFSGTFEVFKYKWKEFREHLGIPDKYNTTDAIRFCMKPAIKELSQINPNTGKVTIEDLKFEIIKDKTKRGRGGEVKGIVFHFKKQKRQANHNEIVCEVENNQALIAYKGLNDKEKEAIVKFFNYLNLDLDSKNTWCVNEQEKIIRKAIKLKKDNDIVKVVEHAIKKGWKGLYPVYKTRAEKDYEFCMNYIKEKEQSKKEENDDIVKL